MRPPLHESKEWLDLISAEQFLENSKQQLDSCQAGTDGANTEAQLQFIVNLAARFDGFYAPKCAQLDAYYENFDEGTNDHRMYDERYSKFKIEAELHRGALNRRKSEQSKLIEFVSSCEACSGRIGALINQITSDDWSDENKDVQAAERELATLTAAVNTEFAKIDAVLANGPIVQTQIQIGKSLVNSKIEQ